MAVNKVINTKSTSHGALRNTLEYVLRDEKAKEGFVDITGPYTAQAINYEDVYREWISEKQLWGKDSGRMYAHNMISFHKDEAVSPQEVLDIGKEFAERFFSGYQSVISVHQDRDHLHCHIVTNSVSYIDGIKLHQTKKDLQAQKEFTNSLCKDRGLSVTEKGFHFDGTPIGVGHLSTWSKDKYNLIHNSTAKSYVVQCGMALIDAVPSATSREGFIAAMKEKGWDVQWTDNRKHIVFQNEQGQKVRDSNIEKTFSMALSKEYLLEVFRRNEEQLLLSGDKKNDMPIKTRTHTRVSIREKIAEKNATLKHFRFDDKFHTTLINTAKDKYVQNYGLMDWAQGENFKRAASIFCRLCDLNLAVDAVRSERIQELGEQLEKDKSALKNTENEIKSLYYIMHHAEIYQNNMIFQNTVNTSGGRYKEKYKNDHEEELRMFESAKRWLENNGVDPSSLNFQDLATHYNDLLARKELLKGTYFSRKKEHEDLVNMDKSLHDFLNPPEQPLPIKIKEHYIGR